MSVARIATVGRGLRPGELVQVLFGTAECVRRVMRTEQWIERDGGSASEGFRADMRKSLDQFSCPVQDRCIQRPNRPL